MAAAWKSQPIEVIKYWLSSLQEPSVLDKLTEWESKFITNIDWWIADGKSLTQKQHETLERIYATRTN